MLLPFSLTKQLRFAIICPEAGPWLVRAVTTNSPEPPKLLDGLFTNGLLLFTFPELAKLFSLELPLLLLEPLLLPLGPLLLLLLGSDPLLLLLALLLLLLLLLFNNSLRLPTCNDIPLTLAYRLDN